MKFLNGAISILVIWCTKVFGLYNERILLQFNTSEVPKDALFGYSVSYQANIQRLLVSAPKSNLEGEVYSCEISNQKCSKKHAYISGGARLTNMWFGAHVSSYYNFSVACAPRYTEKKNKVGTFSRCYASQDGNNFTTSMKTLPIDNNLPQYELNMDSLGWSSHIDKRGNILIGGPAMSKGRAVMYSSITAKPKILDFTTGQKFYILYNFGYSVTSGLFFSSNESDIVYAISSTFGEYGVGQVILTNGSIATALENPHEYSPPAGSMFGASLCSAKLRGPGQREALLVSAPTYACDGKMDVGAVYIYLYNQELQQIKHEKTVLGTAEAGQFGSTMIDLGDLNGDARSEIAIAAPYENEGQGAVYIYSATDLLADVPVNSVKWLQRIQPAGYKTFGLSLTALPDYDNNGCNELVIGAPESNKVVLLQCMAKIIVKVRNLEECVTPEFSRAKRNDSYFVFHSCIDITYSEKPENATADIQVTVSIMHLKATLANSLDNSLTYNIKVIEEKKSTYCEEVGIILPTNDTYDPDIQYKVSAIQTDSPYEDTEFNPSHAILSDLSILSHSGFVWVADCAGNHECNPELTFDIHSSMKEEYVIGSNNTEIITVSVTNMGDIAYRACAHVKVNGVLVRHWQPSCTLDGDVIICTPQQPIRNNTQWSTGNIEVETKGLKSDATKITLSVKLFPHCGSDKKSQEKNKTITLKTDPAGMVVKGSTNLGNNIQITRNELEETGKQVTHTYTVINGGKITWVDLKCDVTVEYKPYFQNAIVMVKTQTSFERKAVSSGTDGKNRTIFTISELKPNRNFDVLISMYIEPGKLDSDYLKKENQLLPTELVLHFGANVLTQKVVSSLKFVENSVPLWIIIVAVLVGLLIIVIIAFILHECGFLRRKNKEMLQTLKKDVYRQSIRRSMALRDSMRTAHSNRTAEDLDKLVDNPSEPTESEAIRKELIILGLQKNVGLQGFKPRPDKPKHKPPPRPDDKKET